MTIHQQVCCLVAVAVAVFSSAQLRSFAGHHLPTVENPKLTSCRKANRVDDGQLKLLADHWRPWSQASKWNNADCTPHQLRRPMFANMQRFLWVSQAHIDDIWYAFLTYDTYVISSSMPFIGCQLSFFGPWTQDISRVQQWFGLGGLESQ